MHVTEQREGVASVAELLGVIHTVDNRAAALSGVQEVICIAWVGKKEWRHSENIQAEVLHRAT